MRRFSHIPTEGGSLRIAHLQFLAKSHICWSHHILTSEDFATDIYIVEYAEEHVEMVQFCALRSHGLGCGDVNAPSEGASPELATKAHKGQIQQALAGYHLKLTYNNSAT